MTDDDGRPDPDRLLSLLNKEEDKERRGRLKIFLGMAAGVGKTYAMLRVARELKANGVDVVVGFVETHGRADTQAQLVGLEILPRRRIEHRGVQLEEFDVDAALKRKSQVVLVDELAHTNAPGSRHAKRYLDVKEILDAGINVFTTLNVQHLDSRAETVREITGAAVRETIPDSILDEADEVVLIDLTAQELLKRLREGKIYPQERIPVATRNFFRAGNLTALREMALRVATERADRETRSYKQLYGIASAWKSGQRLLVAVFASPYSEALIRWTRRLADLTGATWIGAYVDTGRPQTDKEKELLARNFALVHQLGGEVMHRQDRDPVRGLLQIARQNDVTQIVIGKTRRPWWHVALSRGGIGQRLIEESGDIDVYVVSAGAAERRALWRKRMPAFSFPGREAGYVAVIGLSAWALAQFLEPWIGYVAVGTVFVMTVCFAGLVLSRFSVLMLAGLFFAIHNFFFIPPLFTFKVEKPEDIMTLMLFFIAAATMGHLTRRLKSNERILAIREERALLLYDFSKALAHSRTVDEVASVGVKEIEKAIDSDVVIFLPVANDAPPLRSYPPYGFSQGENEHAVANWVFEHQRPAGRFTDTLSAAMGYYIPLQVKERTVGVLGVQAKNLPLDPDQLALLETCSHQLAAALDAERHRDQMRQLQVMEESQKLYKTLLDSVSHEIKTPLSAIRMASSAILDPTIRERPGVMEELGKEIYTGSFRLQRIVENLLDISRIESGALTLKLVPCDVNDLVTNVLGELDDELAGRPVRVTIPDDLRPIQADAVLFSQVLLNILHNAAVYTPAGTALEIGAWSDEAIVEVSVRDHGPGLPLDGAARVFEKFFRASPEHTGGLGLGLSIAKNIMSLHGGTIEAMNHPEGGAIFRLRMPVWKGR